MSSSSYFDAALTIYDPNRNCAVELPQSSFTNTKATMKRQRRRRTAGGIIGGAIVGGVTLGPFGAIAGGVVGGMATKNICKAGERRAERAHYDTMYEPPGNILAYKGFVA